MTIESMRTQLSNGAGGMRLGFRNGQIELARRGVDL